MSQNDLRSALERADVGTSHSLPVSGRAVVEQLDQRSMVVQRLPISRVDIKVEVAAFIDHHFLNRTTNDGSVLHLSKERLIEELTVLFHSLENRAADIDNSSFRKKAQPAKGNPEKTRNAKVSEDTAGEIED